MGDYEAVQCLAAYEISLAKGSVSQDSSLLRMISHPNPNLYSVVDKISYLWNSESEKMLGEWGRALIAEAKEQASQRTQGHAFTVDKDALALLAPVPPTRNGSISLQSVLEAGNRTREEIRYLDIPAALNVSNGSFQECAAAVHEIGLRLRSNATDREFALLSVEAKDQLSLQQQGEALASIQWRLLEEDAAKECLPSSWHPDINNNAGEGGLTFTQLICIGIAIILVLIGLVVACCCACRRYRRRKREMREIANQNALLPPQGVPVSVSMCEDMPPSPSGA